MLRPDAGAHLSRLLGQRKWRDDVPRSPVGMFRKEWDTPQICEDFNRFPSSSVGPTVFFLSPKSAPLCRLHPKSSWLQSDNFVGCIKTPQVRLGVNWVNIEVK